MNAILDRLEGGLIVSCQAYPGEPMRHTDTMARVARSVLAGGAAAIRVQGLEDVRATASLGAPVVGLWKDGGEGVFITPTLEHAQAVAEAGAHIVAIDGTTRPRPDGRDLRSTITALKARYEILVMADCGSVDDALAAQAAGADLVGTTLAGYTGSRPRTEGPDIELVRELSSALTCPVVAEGRIHTPQQAAEALDAGAFAVCVGTAITHPSTITRWFVDALSGAEG